MQSRVREEMACRVNDAPPGSRGSLRPVLALLVQQLELHASDSIHSFGVATSCDRAVLC